MKREILWEQNNRSCSSILILYFGMFSQSEIRMVAVNDDCSG